ncbi:uncharacterized protein SPAPADRAFT_58157 [Spathaspora passalidarum NRRL Y-27907]|uniref:CTLH/CRA C-terminal to LisH motif domain-containing protein n=1 Tax=Spathaspora passalidarum (strain NRRL Y-27907 / 11-Y1) TaxID=619300 RepID=G3AFN6_SPAPN|nr:uncharacterized protein SPAPADRAFT_58157 [Spathaspora passalidarum NRRL Y-27907]EGW35025.1 hypothetical protein SPAPADRAFT_58157 [Spathaspora passalidarum NRRL Y-27907]
MHNVPFRTVYATYNVTRYSHHGDKYFYRFRGKSPQFLDGLKSIESELEEQLKLEETQMQTEDTEKDIVQKEHKTKLHKLEKLSDKWYHSSISNLKSYNSATNRISKNVLNNSKFNVELDDAYTYPLNLDSFPVNGNRPIMPSTTPGDSDLKMIKLENREELIKAIILHLLKIGQCDIVKEVARELPENSPISIDENLSEKFEKLHQIVDSIISNHDLTLALAWFKDKYNEQVAKNGMSTTSTDDNASNIEFKYHMLQFTILFNGKDSSFGLDDALAAYLYSKDNFSRFFKDYLHEISPLMTLLLFKTKTNDDDDAFSRKHMVSVVRGFIERIKQGFDMENDSRNSLNQGETKFVSELLNSFENIHSNQSLFVNISNEFISEYCKFLKLSNDSSLFQSILAGHIYLPSFYKYNQIQSKLTKIKAVPDSTKMEESSSSTATHKAENDVINYTATYHFELPFQLPDSNRFLFNYHPIFICPVSREQLIPITETMVEAIKDEEGRRKRKRYLVENPLTTQVVVLEFCKHLALKDSVYHLSKKGTEIFKCHYCYKKHKYTDVTPAYFIDL